jgi:hypothetical protein
MPQRTRTRKLKGGVYRPKKASTLARYTLRRRPVGYAQTKQPFAKFESTKRLRSMYPSQEVYEESAYQYVKSIEPFLDSLLDALEDPDHPSYDSALDIAEEISKALPDLETTLSLPESNTEDYLENISKIKNILRQMVVKYEKKLDKYMSFMKQKRTMRKYKGQNMNQIVRDSLEKELNDLEATMMLVAVYLDATVSAAKVATRNMNSNNSLEININANANNNSNTNSNNSNNNSNNNSKSNISGMNELSSMLVSLKPFKAT